MNYLCGAQMIREEETGSNDLGQKPQPAAPSRGPAAPVPAAMRAHMCLLTLGLPSSLDTPQAVPTVGVGIWG